MKKKIAVLGSTGSVGRNALEVIKQHPESFELTALSAHTNTLLLEKQIAEFSPAYVAVTGPASAMRKANGRTKLCYGSEALFEACVNADVVMLAILGIAGLPVFEYCLRNHIPVALATKEAMVCGGRMARRLMDETGTPVLPVDSELSAIWQCLEGNKKQDVKSVLLTASGGPFRTWPKDRICTATKKDALNHPNWSMGEKITVDCATMINKGLEIMETRWLFDIPPEKIKVVVHPESIIHSMVEFKDNVVMAQLGDKDMKIPILHALSYPERLTAEQKPLDIFEVSTLSFEKPDLKRFPCLELAYEAVKDDGALQLVLNSANEVAVRCFLDDKISFIGIYDILIRALEYFSDVKVDSFQDIYEVDREVRAYLAQL